MRRVEIRLKDDNTPFLNMLFVIDFNTTIVRLKAKLDERVEKLEMVVDFCRITPTLKGDPEHICSYSKTIDQPQPTFTIDQLVDILKDEDFIRNVCASYDHSFGLLTEQQRQQQMFNCREYLHAITNNLPYHEVKPTYTRDIIAKAAFNYSKRGVDEKEYERYPETYNEALQEEVCMFLSELDKVKEGK